MTRRRVILLALSVLLLGVIIYCLVPNAEPVYNGKKLSEWLRIAIKPVPLHPFRSNSPAPAGPIRDWQNALSAIRAIGTNGLPTVRRLLRSRDGSIKRGLKEFVNTRGIFGLHLATDVEKVTMAVRAIDTLDSDALPLLPDLLKVGQDPNPKLRGLAVSTVYSLMKQDITRIEPCKPAVLTLLASTIDDPGLHFQTVSAVSLLKESDKDRVRAIWLEQHPDQAPATNTYTPPK